MIFLLSILHIFIKDKKAAKTARQLRSSLDCIQRCHEISLTGYFDKERKKDNSAPAVCKFDYIQRCNNKAARRQRTGCVQIRLHFALSRNIPCGIFI